VSLALPVASFLLRGHAWFIWTQLTDDKHMLVWKAVKKYFHSPPWVLKWEGGDLTPNNGYPENIKITQGAQRLC
jgi:hypothetical protein